MRVCFFALISIVVLFNQSPVWSQSWVQLPVPANVQPLRLDFVNPSVGWAISNYSVIKTTDGGQSWNVQSSPTTNMMNDVCFVSETQGWIVSDAGGIFHTTTGGDTWQLQESGTVYPLKVIHFADELHGWAIGFGPGVVGTFLYTINGGENWLSTDCPCLFNDFDFVNTTTGWMVCDNGDVYSSYDGGQTIEPIYFSNDVTLRNVDFVNEGIGWMVGVDGFIQKTLNGGLSWYDVVPPFGYYLFGLSFVTADFGAVSGASSIAVTSDAGQTWSSTQILNSYIPDVEMLDESSGYAACGLSILKYCPLAITTQAINVETTEGNATQLSIQTNSANATYQWQVLVAGNWENVPNDGVFSGSNTNVLSISVVQGSATYRCVVSDGGCEVLSNATTVVGTASIQGLETRELLLFPNPAQHSVQLHVPSDCVGEDYYLSDVSGRILQRGRLNGTRLDLDLHLFSSGSYLVRVNNMVCKFEKL
jgi:photosystem II stability/assembly factor-like uncharacterized protein